MFGIPKPFIVIFYSICKISVYERTKCGRVANSCSPKIIHVVSLVQLRCKNCRDLRDFLRVKFGLKVLLRVKVLTFCNSASECTIFLFAPFVGAPQIPSFSILLCVNNSKSSKSLNLWNCITSECTIFLFLGAIHF